MARELGTLGMDVDRPDDPKVERPKKLSLTGTSLKREHYQWDAGGLRFGAVWFPES